nr:hypothetical protein [Tanacetum cinerariifolium]
MELYMLNRQHGRMILESVEHGPLLWHTVEEDGGQGLRNILNSPQIDYAPMVQQLSEYSPPEAGLVGRQNFVSAGSSRPFTSGSGRASGKQRVIICYNRKGEGHMSKQCTKPKRKRDAEWFKDKVLLV